MGNSDADAAQAMDALTSLRFHGPFTFVDHDGSGIAKSEFAHSQGIYLWVQTDGTGQRCKAPAVRGYNVCRFHGAHGGAPKGKANGAWKHGHYSKAAKAERLLVKLLLKNVSSLRKLLSKGET